MSERRINLEEILDNFVMKQKDSGELTYNTALLSMKDAVKQALELAAENATVRGNNFVRVVDKQSIIDTINQII